MHNIIDTPFPVLGLAAWSGTGKTTLLTQLLPRLRDAGLVVGVIKHAHHRFDIDQPGKDSYQLRSAGAAPMLIASRQRFALMQETPGQEDPDLAHLLSLMVPHQPDLVIVEGFKEWPIAKLVVYREGIGDAAIVNDEWVRAVALKGPVPAALSSSAERLNLDDIEEITQWVVNWVAKQSHPAA